MQRDIGLESSVFPALAYRQEPNSSPGKLPDGVYRVRHAASPSIRLAKRIRDDIAPKVAADAAYQKAKENTPHSARMAHDQALGKVMQHLRKDDTQVYKQYVEK